MPEGLDFQTIGIDFVPMYIRVQDGVTVYAWKGLPTRLQTLIVSRWTRYGSWRRGDSPLETTD
jgi:hypothetical protein